MSGIFSLVWSGKMIRWLGFISYAFKFDESLHRRLVLLKRFCKLSWSEPNGQQKAAQQLLLGAYALELVLGGLQDCP